MKRLYKVCVLSLSTNELTMWVEHEKKTRAYYLDWYFYYSLTCKYMMYTQSKQPYYKGKTSRTTKIQTNKLMRFIEQSKLILHLLQ